jgi:hypothetical protein
MGGSWFHDFADTTHHASALSILTFAHAIQVGSIRPLQLGSANLISPDDTLV